MWETPIVFIYIYTVDVHIHIYSRAFNPYCLTGRNQTIVYIFEVHLCLSRNIYMRFCFYQTFVFICIPLHLCMHSAICVCGYVFGRLLRNRYVGKYVQEYGYEYIQKCMLLKYNWKYIQKYIQKYFQKNCLLRKTFMKRNLE